MNNIFSVKGKVVVITGGMGQLGSQYTKVFLENGAYVAVFDLNTGKKNGFLLSQEKNPALKIIRTDITKRSSLLSALAKTIKFLGSPSVLLNNAALDAPPGASGAESSSFETYSERSWDKVCAVNLKGMFLSCQVIGTHMAENSGGSIINISSIYGNVSPDQRIYSYRAKKGLAFVKPVSYSVTKAGVINFSRYLATYWAKKNVRVNTLSLGGVFNGQDKEFLKGYSFRVPMGRMAKEDEYNGAVLFLASEASSYMTGSNVVIDGGFTAW